MPFESGMNDPTPRFADLIGMFDRSVARFPTRPCLGLRRLGHWDWLTYEQVAEHVDALRGGLAMLGVTARDRVAIIANNRFEWCVAAYGTYGLGAVYVPMSETRDDAEWAFVLRDCEATVCLAANPVIAHRVEALSDGLPALKHIVNLDDEYDAVCEIGRAMPAPGRRPDPEAVGCTIYPTREPVRLTHRDLAAGVGALVDVTPVTEQDRTLAFLPWSDVGGVELDGVMAVGASVAICEDPTQLWDQLPEVAPTVLFAAPRILNRIHDALHAQIRRRPAPIRALFDTALTSASKRRDGAPRTVGERLALPIADRLIFGRIRARFGGRLRLALSGAPAPSIEVREFVDSLGITVLEAPAISEPVRPPAPF